LNSYLDVILGKYMKYALEKNYTYANQSSHLTVIFHSFCSFGGGEVGYFHTRMIKSKCKRSKLLLTSLCNTSWGGEIKPQLRGRQGSLSKGLSQAVCPSVCRVASLEDEAEG
jgi:hypothetical protein